MVDGAKDNSKSFLRSLVNFGAKGALGVTFMASLIYGLVGVMALAIEKNAENPENLLADRFKCVAFREAPEPGMTYYRDLSEKVMLTFARNDDAFCFLNRALSSWFLPWANHDELDESAKAKEVRRFDLGYISSVKKGAAWKIDDRLELTPEQITELFNREIESIMDSKEFKNLSGTGYKGQLFAATVRIEANKVKVPGL